MSTLNLYQSLAAQFARYPRDVALSYTTLGLAGEAGEVANIYKKALRDDNGVVTKERKEKMLDELGDVLWYVSAVAGELGLSLEQVAQYNVNKLAGRTGIVPTLPNVSHMEKPEPGASS